MPLVDVLSPDDLEAIRQMGLNWLDQAGRVLQDLARDNDIEITVKVKPRKESE